jgi:hypothetical protein
VSCSRVSGEDIGWPARCALHVRVERELLRDVRGGDDEVELERVRVSKVVADGVDGVGGAELLRVRELVLLAGEGGDLGAERVAEDDRVVALRRGVSGCARIGEGGRTSPPTPMTATFLPGPAPWRTRGE